MGQYKLYVVFKWQLGFIINYQHIIGVRSLTIKIPFLTIKIGLEKEAKGVYLFRKDIYKK